MRVPLVVRGHVVRVATVNAGLNHRVAIGLRCLVARLGILLEKQVVGRRQMVMLVVFHSSSDGLRAEAE